MNYKPFDKEEYDENDYKAKVLAARFLECDGRFKLRVPIREQPERLKKGDFKIELLKTGRDIMVEAERKKVWTERGKWQGWPTLDVPYRKCESKAEVFIMCNVTFDTIAVAMMKKVLDANVSKKNASCSKVKTEMEPFFKVPIYAVRFFKALNTKRTEWVEITRHGTEVRHG